MTDKPEIDILHKINLALVPYRSKVYNIPATGGEIVELERQLGMTIPLWFKSFLLGFGLKQDFIFGLVENTEQIVQGQEALPDEFKAQYLMVGNNGGEEYWLINANNENDHLLYEWQYWGTGDIVPMVQTFEELIDASVLRIKEHFDSLPLNSEKHWNVQFSIPANNEQRILETIGAQTITAWQQTEVTPAGVICSQCTFALNGREIILEKSEYRDWAGPVYSFDMHEPYANVVQNSAIKALDSRFKKAFDGYTLIDYGIH